MKMMDLLQGDGVAIEVDQGQIITYPGLRKRVVNYAAKWRAQYSSSVLKHQVVVIQASSPLDQIVSIFTCFHLGMIVNVGCDPKLLKAEWLCRDGDLQPIHIGKREYGTAVDMLFLTSGTTEVARIVGHRQMSLITCAKEMAAAIDLQSDSRVALTLPLSFHYGFSVVTSTFVSNATLLLPSTQTNDSTFSFRLNEWLQNVSPTVLATVPQGWTLFSRMLSETVWKNLEKMVSAGDLISLSQLHHLAEKNPNGTIHIFYGSTEVLRTCHRQWESSDLEGCIGFPLPSVHLNQSEDVFAQQGATLFEEIWEGDLCTRSVDSWLLQDELRQDQDGLWYFVNRSTDVLKVAGQRLSPLVIERNLIQVQGVEDAVVVENDGQLLAILYVSSNSNLATMEVVMPQRYVPKRWIVLHQPFPLTHRQKRSRKWIQHYACQHVDSTQTPPFRLITH